MLTGRKTGHLLHQLFRPTRLGHPDHAGGKHISHRVESCNLVVTLGRGELLHWYPHRPQLKHQRRTRRFGLDDQRVRLPLSVLPLRTLLQLGKLHPALERIQQDNVGLEFPPVVGMVKHPPRRTSRVVRALGLQKRSIPRLDDEITGGRVILGPHFPPLALDDGRHVGGGLLLILRHPLAVGQLLTQRLQLLDGPKLRPQRLARGHDGRKLNDLPLLSVALRRRFYHLPGQVFFGPSGSDDDNGPTRLQTLPGAGGVPLVGLVVYLRVSLGHGGLLFRVRIVNNEQVGALPSHRTPHTDGKVVTTLVSRPPTRRFRVRLQLHVRKNVRVSLLIDQISHFTTKTSGQLGSVGGLNDLFVRKSPQKPRREQV